MSFELGRLRYRARQFKNGLAPRLNAHERRLIAQTLSPAEQALFWQMNGYGQRHALDVYHRLVRLGCQDRELLTAALLHDVGKGSISLAHRVAIVLLERLAPRLLAWLAAAPAPLAAIRRGFYLAVHHPVIGADLAARAGTSAGAVDLIRRHAKPAGADRRLALLQVADDDS